ncbi:hypothetical protein ES319_D07G037800v1 [Gossypium barbadense]|uniref:VQ domain-containing protein n=1 Tax=Gossypium barbadense TaxID=3634 RepID=A0A5J5QNN0_GOSBA|nr:hypothetical protein ES319_D07G037800v1 [Gossypium barbadense]
MFVQADANTFRDLVQKLTGFTGSDTDKLPGRLSSTAPRRPPFKLQERRQHAMRNLEIKIGTLTTCPTNSSPTQSCSPGQVPRLDSPSPSPVTPLSFVWEEEKAIAEKGFYLHPSPLNMPRGSQPPELLTLFPLTSHRQDKRE